MRGVAAYPAQHCLRLGFLGAGVEGGGEGGEGGTHGPGMGREGVRGWEGQPAAPVSPRTCFTQESSSMSQPFSSCPPHWDVTSCLEHPGSAPLEKGTSWAPAERLPRAAEGDARPCSPQCHPQRHLQRGLAAALFAGSPLWTWVKKLK